MFAVSGWNVSADKLKTQTEKPKSEKRKEKKQKQREGRGRDGRMNESQKSVELGGEASSKNAQRDPSQLKRQFEKASQGNPNKELSNGSNKRIKLERTKPDSRTNDASKVEDAVFKQLARSKSTKKPPKSKQKTRDQNRIAYDASRTTDERNGHGLPPKTYETSVNLTPMQSAMRAKLMGSRFRYLNEALYTKPSMESVRMFSENPNFFHEYHAGFRQQVSSWPENPIDSFYTELERRGKTFEKGAELRALPRTAGICRVADLGCGDASLAKKVKAISKARKIEVDSYDLHSTEPSVIKADIASLPVVTDSVSVAILCLALMGTNWIDFIEEAWRILHWKGELWVAEIKSRFSRTQRRPPDHSVGKKRKPNKEELKKQKQLVDQEQADRTIAEMDGAAEAVEKTDVSGFAAVLQKRGFGLADDNAVDLSNKMFVRMKFVKNRPPLKGKLAGEGAKKKNWRELLREGENDDLDEAAILQPCLYKLR